MRVERRLTEFSHGAGCACKLGPSQLQEVLGTLQAAPVPAEILVGADTGDDAAVYRLNDEQAVVATLDFFTPIVDDPYDWGRIAATNALSDVYAMGGRPILALNIVAWPVDSLPLETLGRVLQGGQDVATAAGIPVVGGHSITDDEPKYGMVALGLVHPDRILTNANVPAGAALFLTKPIGLGMISTAIKRGEASESQVRAAIDTMTTLNAGAAEAMVDAGAEAATDVTGFGLVGHLQKMMRASRVAAELDAGAVPLLEGVLDLARSGSVAGGTRRNHEYVRADTDWGALTEPEQWLLADAQTSGGLLIATTDPVRLREALRSRGIAAAEVGVTREGAPGSITVTGRIPGG
ncbi:MAG: selenide, water dikinase SelD [Actinomycetota bacterium]